MKPVIAMPNVRGGLFRAYMKRKYVTSLARAGARVRWIDMEDVDKAVEQMLGCDGLLLPGGGDVNPERYGQAILECCGKPDDLRDRAEFAMLEAFLPVGKPILGICRGVQLMNVYYGGTLHQDIKGIQDCEHSQWRGKNTGTHLVRLEPKSKLSGILGICEGKVNSLHHQALDALGPGLSVAAVSEDGFIEGVEAVEHPFCIGVQWHPEHMAKRSPVQRKLFDAFVAACAQRV